MSLIPYINTIAQENPIVLRVDEPTEAGPGHRLLKTYDLNVDSETGQLVISYDKGGNTVSLSPPGLSGGDFGMAVLIATDDVPETQAVEMDLTQSGVQSLKYIVNRAYGDIGGFGQSLAMDQH